MECIRKRKTKSPTGSSLGLCICGETPRLGPVWLDWYFGEFLRLSTVTPMPYKLSSSDLFYFAAFYKEAYVGKSTHFSFPPFPSIGINFIHTFVLPKKILAVILRNDSLPLQTILALAYYCRLLHIRPSIPNTI